MEFVGFVVDPITLSLALPRDKIRNVRKECQTLLDSQLVTNYWDILPFQGPSISTTYKTRKNRALGNSETYDSTTLLFPQAKEELV